MRAAAIAVQLIGCGRIGFHGAPGQVDADTDAAGLGPMVVAQTASSGTAVATISYPMTVVDGANAILLVTAQVGDQANDPPVATVAGITYGGLALMPVATIVGIPGNSNVTRSELWMAIAPAVGTNTIQVTISSVMPTLESGAAQLIGIDQVSPVRAMASMSGDGPSSSVTVDALPGDLVFDVVGQGDVILLPGAGQSQVWLHNMSSGDTLDNSAASAEIATATSVTLSWTFKHTDYWQEIAVSLVPSP
jgi:hypothetical protein